MRPGAARPSRRNRDSLAEWRRSGPSRPLGSPNTVPASSNETPCLARFTAAFRASHWNTVQYIRNSEGRRDTPSPGARRDPRRARSGGGVAGGSRFCAVDQRPSQSSSDLTTDPASVPSRTRVRSRLVQVPMTTGITAAVAAPLVLVAISRPRLRCSAASAGGSSRVVTVRAKDARRRRTGSASAPDPRPKAPWSSCARL